MSRRVKYSTAGEAARASIAHANQGGPLTGTDLKVLLAVHALTSSWSRLTDRVSLSQLADLAGLPAAKTESQAHQRRQRVSGSLVKLASRQAVVYQPGGRGRGRLSVVGLPEPEKGIRADPPNSEEKGVRQTPLNSSKGDTDGREKGIRAYPPPEKVSEKKPNQRGESAKTTLSPEWFPSGWREGEKPSVVLQKFRLHHQGEGNLAADWNAKWQRWLLDERPDHSNGDGGTKGTGKPRGVFDAAWAGTPDGEVELTP